MASRKAQQEPPPRLRLVVSEAEARQKIQTQIERGSQIEARALSSEEDLRQAIHDKQAWSDYNKQLLLNLFNDRSILWEYFPNSIRMVRTDFAVPLYSRVRALQEDVDYFLGRLRSILASLELYVEPGRESQATQGSTGDSLYGLEGSAQAKPSTQAGGFTIINNWGEVHMGDVFRNISGSTIVNRSLVERSFNKVRDEYGDDSAQAIVKVAELVEQSGDQEAAEVFEHFNEELQKPEPKRTVLRMCWEGLVKAVPTLLQLTEVAASIEKLLAPPHG